MVERRKIRTEKGLALVPGANKLSGGCNFAVEVPEGSQASLVLYKRDQENLLWRFLLRKKKESGICMRYPSRIFSQRHMNIILW